MSDYYEELVDENDELKLILHIKERELRAARKVVRESYQSLAYTYQGHLIEYKGNIDMSVFDRGLYDLLPNNDRAVFDALLAYEEAMKS